MAREMNAVLDYMALVNRPCSVNEICASMQNEFSKNVILKALEQLKENKIREKIYNKQKIYSIIQNSSVEAGDIEKAVQECELEILQKTEKLKKLENELRVAECELQKYNSTLTLAQAEERRRELETSIETLNAKLSNLPEKKTSVSQIDRVKIEKEYHTAVNAYKSRKRICTDILNSIAENYPKPKSALIEDIGLELDNEENTPLM